MRIPHTIPRVILRAYARKLDDEALQKSYEGRLLRSEDPTWDEKVQPTLSQLCLDNILEEYVFYVKLIEELNTQKKQNHEKEHDQWVLDVDDYNKRMATYEQKKIEQEIEATRREQQGDDPTAADDDFYDEDDKPIKLLLIEPTKVLEEFPTFVPINSVLDQMCGEDRVRAVEDLDIEYVPFDIAITTIPDEYYWERVALDRWPSADSDKHGKKWRRLFVEKSLWDEIEQFHPIDGNVKELQTQIDLVAPEILEIRLNNLIPNCFGTPRKPLDSKTPDADYTAIGGEEDEGYGDDEYDDEPQDEKVTKNSFKQEGEALEDDDEVEENIDPSAIDTTAESQPDRTSSSHINFELILPKLINLKVLSLVYEMAETGLDWEPRMFKFTDEDCLNLAKALAQSPSIETFELNRSHVNDEQCKTLVREGLMKMTHLKILNLNYNRIGNAGARAIARLLSDESARGIHTIHTVGLARNKIYNAGGKALAWALTKNHHLTHLDLRLNRLGNSAGRDFAYALVKNKSLLFLSLGANRLTDVSAQVFGKMMHHNSSLKELDLSSNDIGKKGGEHVALGIRSNKNILRVDVRLANIGLDFEYDVGSHLRKNRNRILGQYSLVERDDHYPNETESAVIDPNAKEAVVLVEPKWNDEEEATDGEEEMDGDHDEEEMDGDHDEEEMHGDHDEEEMMALKTVKAPVAMIGSNATVA